MYKKPHAYDKPTYIYTYMVIIPAHREPRYEPTIVPNTGMTFSITITIQLISQSYFTQWWTWKEVQWSFSCHSLEEGPWSDEDLLKGQWH